MNVGEVPAGSTARHQLRHSTQTNKADATTTAECGESAAIKEVSAIAFLIGSHIFCFPSYSQDDTRPPGHVRSKSRRCRAPSLRYTSLLSHSRVRNDTAGDSRRVFASKLERAVHGHFALFHADSSGITSLQGARAGVHHAGNTERRAIWENELPAPRIFGRVESSANHRARK